MGSSLHLLPESHRTIAVGAGGGGLLLLFVDEVCVCYFP